MNGTTITRGNRVYQVPHGYDYHVGEESGVKYTVIPSDISIINDSRLFAYTIDLNILFVCDISEEQGLALAFPGINLKKIEGTEIILLSKEGDQHLCRDFGYEW